MAGTDEIEYEQHSSVIEEIKNIVQNICLINYDLYGEIRDKIKNVLTEFYAIVNRMTHTEKTDYSGFSVVPFVDKYFDKTPLHQDIIELVGSIWNDETSVALKYYGAFGWSTTDILRIFDYEFTKHYKPIISAYKIASVFKPKLPASAIHLICRFSVVPEQKIYIIQISDEDKCRLAREEKIAKQFAEIATIYFHN